MHLPNGAVELILITLQKSVMGCSVNLFLQYKMYLRNDISKDDETQYTTLKMIGSYKNV